jgi:putative glycerol-1-phosphate prenyltransferase
MPTFDTSSIKPLRTNNIYNSILDGAKSKRKKIALLIDPDKFNPSALKNAIAAGVDFIFVGGSLLSQGSLQQCIKAIKKTTHIPLVLFPGATDQIDPLADGILFLSLISGRNPDNLIGKHVISAPLLKKTSLEIIPTGYMLIDGGNSTSASYMSNTIPIPYNKSDIAVCTAMAGEMLGLKLIYMDTGSGALKHVSANMIKEVKKNMDIPLIIGGGIKTPQDAYDICTAGADIIVIGTIAEQSPELIMELVSAVNQSSNYIASLK